MKFVPHAAAISLVATQAAAGGLSDAIVETPEVMEPEVMAEPQGSAGWMIPVLIVGALAAVALAGSDEDDEAAPAPVCTAPTPTPPVCS